LEINAEQGLMLRSRRGQLFILIGSHS